MLRLRLLLPSLLCTTDVTLLPLAPARAYSSLPPAPERPKPKRTPPRNRQVPPLPPLTLSDLAITYVRGSGPGGQVINKSSISCSIIHLPTGLRVQCHETRSRETNRIKGMRIMQGKLDQLWNPGTSQAEIKWAREGRKKASKTRKRKRKEGVAIGASPSDEADHDDDYDDSGEWEEEEEVTEADEDGYGDPNEPIEMGNRSNRLGRGP